MLCLLRILSFKDLVFVGSKRGVRPLALVFWNPVSISATPSYSLNILLIPTLFPIALCYAVARTGKFWPKKLDVICRDLGYMAPLLGTLQSSSDYQSLSMYIFYLYSITDSQTIINLL